MTIRNRVIEKPIVIDAIKENMPMLLDEKKAANLLGVSISFLRKSRSEGARFERTPAPPFVALGGRRYYRLTDLRAWVDGLAESMAT